MHRPGKKPDDFRREDVLAHEHEHAHDAESIAPRTAAHQQPASSHAPTDSTLRPLGMGAGLSGERNTAAAATEAAQRALEELERSIGAQPAGAARSGIGDVDLAIVLVSPHHISAINEALAAINSVLAPRNLLAVSAEAVLGGFLELEGIPGISILAASLPGVRIVPFSSDDLPMSLGVDEAADEGADLDKIARAVGMLPGHRCTILFADPFTTPVTGILPVLARARSLCETEGVSSADGPGRRGAIVGGIASAASRAGGNVLVVNGQVRHQGLVGVSLCGPVRVDAVVSQGCRPFGPNMIVTSAHDNIIRSLGGRPALEVIREHIESLPDDARALLARGLMLGRVVDEYRDRFGPGDYLMRAVVKVSPEDESILVADHIRVGQTVRLHLRDTQTAERDLAMLMDSQALHDRPVGGLLITCNGRGTRLFNKPNHDVTVIQRAFMDPGLTADTRAGEQRAKGGVSIRHQPTDGRSGFPLAGFFALGEIGPVGDGVFLHGHTACAVLFRRP